MSTAINNEITDARRLGAREWKIALAIGLLAGLVHLALATQRGFWGDEYLTILSTRLGLLAQCKERIAAGHSPLYFIYARLGHLFGEGERAMRFPSALATTMTVLGMTGLAGALGLRRSLPALWGLALIQPYWITLGTQARYMMPLLAEASFAMWAAAAYVENYRARRGVLLALALGLTLWTHSTAQFFAAGLLIFLIWELAARPPGGRFTLWTPARLWPVLAGIASSLPLLYLTRNHNAAWPARFPSLSELKRDLLETIFADYSLWPRFLGFSNKPIYFLELLLLAATAVMAGRALLRRRRATGARLLLSLALATPIGFILFCSLLRSFGSPTRYVALFCLPVAAAMAAAWNAPVQRPILNCYRTLLVLVLVVQSAAAAVERADRHRDGCQWIVENATGQESYVVASDKANILGLQQAGLPREAEFFARNSSDPESSDTRKMLQKALAHHSRVFFINYFTPNSIMTTIRNARHGGLILESRQWEISNGMNGDLNCTVGAFIGKEEDRAWLESLPDPKRSWGPSRQD